MYIIINISFMLSKGSHIQLALKNGEELIFFAKSTQDAQIPYRSNNAAGFDLYRYNSNYRYH